jgi:hypothetical protein
VRTSQTPENNLANDQEQDPNTALESVAKRYNSRRSFTRDEGQKEECGADTRQMLARRPRGATGFRRVRFVFLDCEQAEAAHQCEAPTR